MKVCVITAATNTIPRFRIDMIDEFVRRGCEVVVFGNEPHERWRQLFWGARRFLSHLLRVSQRHESRG